MAFDIPTVARAVAAPPPHGRTAMTLTLKAVSLNEQPLSQPITAHFDAQGGTIGRADGNTLALPDPERHISRCQAEIRGAGAGYTIRNVGSANPILVRGESLARGESTTLAHHDKVRIGGYLLEVIDDDSDAASTITRGRASVEASVPPPRATPAAGTGGILGDLAAPLAASNPFVDLLGPAAPPAARPAARAAPVDPFADLMPPAAGVAAGSAGWNAPPAPATPQLPDDFDPFAPPSAPAPAIAVPPAGGVFDGLIPSAAPASLDAAFGLGASAADDLDRFLATPAAPRPGQAGAVPVDPLEALFPSEPSPAPAASVPDHTPELRAAYVPPAVAAPRPAPRAPEPARAAPAAPAAEVDADAAPLWRAFCEGAGLRADAMQGMTPGQMRQAGRVLREAIEGTLRLVAVRTATKHELRAQVTVIQARNNNPLKFSPDAQVAIEQLLKPPVRGFLPGPEAMADVMDDLLGHSIGTMAGMRAALEGVLDRFAPGELESKLVGKSVLDSVLPMNRKARLWDLYLQKFDAIRGEAQEDFHALFGKAFVAAYEQQIERLDREKAARGTGGDA